MKVVTAAGKLCLASLFIVTAIPAVCGDLKLENSKPPCTIAGNYICVKV